LPPRHGGDLKTPLQESQGGKKKDPPSKGREGVVARFLAEAVGERVRRLDDYLEEKQEGEKKRHGGLLIRTAKLFPISC